MVGPNINAKNKKLKMKWVRTPKSIWKDLTKEFNFTIDACASDKNHLLPRYWTTETDALKQDWDNEIVYCHPLFDRNIPKFIKKAITSKCLTVFLLPSSTNAVYFHEYLWNKNDVEIRFLKRYHTGTGHKFFSEDNEEPICGYLRPLIIVVIDKRIK